ncbi:hypothetical protein [Glaciihabitans sp. UYNi722]|uniref:hypothetical protein n=1 Tax=Glaciihabitans sp. UYNi722 TaxID=3156344 RepID=UPI003395D26C
MLAGGFGAKTSTMPHEQKLTAIVVTAISGGALTLIFAITTIVQWARGESAEDVLIDVQATVVIALVSVGIYLIGRRVVQPRAWRHFTRRITFARANGFTVRPLADPKRTPGPLGQRTISFRRVSDYLSGTQDGVNAESGVFQDRSGNRSTVGITVRYLAVQLPENHVAASFRSGRSIPSPLDVSAAWINILDAKPFGRATIMCARGDADRVRAIYTDGLIAALTTQKHRADAQLVDGWFIAYYPPKASLDPTLWRSMFSVVGTIAAQQETARRAWVRCVNRAASLRLTGIDR